MKTIVLSLQNYIKSSIQELHHVTWPTQRQAVRISAIVIVFMAVAALVLAAVDQSLTWGVQSVINLKK
jgi:preprotein translocase SecE subunit